MFKRKSMLNGVKIRPILNGVPKKAITNLGYKYRGSVRVIGEELLPYVHDDVCVGGYTLMKVGKLYYLPVISDAGGRFADCDVFKRRR